MIKKARCSNKIHIRQGDNVKVISGKYKGQIGRIKRVIRTSNKVIVDGVNVRVKHIKSKTREQIGTIEKMEFPIHVSNVISLKE